MSERGARPNLTLLDPHDERLRQRCAPVNPAEISSPEVRGIIDDMLAVAGGERDVGPGITYMVGLAASQLGIMRRIIVVDTQIRDGKKPSDQAAVPQLTPFVNPKIVEHSDDMEEFREGCFSFHAKDGIYAKVPRYHWVKMSALDRSGQPFDQEFEGYVARILQHETDHLDGIRFPDRMPPGRDLDKVTLDDIETYKNGGWQNWPHKVPRSELE